MHLKGHPLLETIPVLLTGVYFSIGSKSRAGNGMSSKSGISFLSGFLTIVSPSRTVIPATSQIAPDSIEVAISSIVLSPSPLTTASAADLSRHSRSKKVACGPPRTTVVLLFDCLIRFVSSRAELYVGAVVVIPTRSALLTRSKICALFRRSVSASMIDTR